jgi:hypothetical protein
LVCLTTFSFEVYCDDWVLLNNYENVVIYAKPSSVMIDKQNHTIKVWLKTVYTDKGMIDFLKNRDGLDKQQYNDIVYSLVLWSFDYNKWKFSIDKRIFYSKLNNVLSDKEGSHKWYDITTDSVGEVLLNQLLKDYSIQR